MIWPFSLFQKKQSKPQRRPYRSSLSSCGHNHSRSSDDGGYMQGLMVGHALSSNQPVQPADDAEERRRHSEWSQPMTTPQTDMPLEKPTTSHSHSHDHGQSHHSHSHDHGSSHSHDSGGSSDCGGGGDGGGGGGGD